MRFPTLVPTFNTIARNIVDDPVANDVALGVDHRLFRERAQFDDHLVAWGAYLTAVDALERADRGASSPLTPDQRAHLTSLPAAILTVVVLRDGPGFSHDAIAIAVDRPLHEVEWISNQSPAPVFPLTALAAETHVEAEVQAEANTTAGPPPYHAADVIGSVPAPAPLPQPSPQPEPQPAPQPEPHAELHAEPVPAATPPPSRRGLWIALAAALVVVALIIAAAIAGSKANDDRAEADPPTTEPGLALPDPSTGPRLSTLGCEASPMAGTDPFGPELVDLSTAGLPNTATIRADVPSDSPRPLVVAFIPPGTDTEPWIRSTRFEALTAANGGILATLTSADPASWAIPTGRELTPDLAALGVVLEQLGERSCIDPKRVTLVGFGDAADFATTLSCTAPTVASHLVTVGGSTPPPVCVRFDGIGLLTVLDGAAESYNDAVGRYSAFVTERSCPQPTYTTVGAISLAQSGPCERDARFWIGAATEIGTWVAEFDDLASVFLVTSGALAHG